MSLQHHRWVVDMMEDGSAAIEVDGRQVTTIPRWILPAHVREGDVLRVTHERDGERSVLHIEHDRDGTQLAYDASAEQLREPGASRDGGDIVL